MNIAQNTASILAEIRKRKPSIHCITNDAAQAFTADALLALGAEPSLSLAKSEIPEFVGSSDALLVNLGTLDDKRLSAIPVAVAFATQTKKPWVLDPVFVHRSPARREYAAALLAEKPSAVRCNQAECVALTGGGNGAAPGEVLAARFGSVAAVTGEVDTVYGIDARADIENGHVLMSRLTATGCACSAILAACLAVEDDPFAASVAALVLWGIAGEVAGGKVSAPGSFRPALLDALYQLKATNIKRRAKAALRETAS
ncbi:MAG: hydroxyethylthiazole kinase [Hyphomicrobiales bacterium]